MIVTVLLYDNTLYTCRPDTFNHFPYNFEGSHPQHVWDGQKPIWHVSAGVPHERTGQLMDLVGATEMPLFARGHSSWKNSGMSTLIFWMQHDSMLLKLCSYVQNCVDMSKEHTVRERTKPKGHFKKKLCRAGEWCKSFQQRASSIHGD